jgi:hypothetical protein
MSSLRNAYLTCPGPLAMRAEADLREVDLSSENALPKALRHRYVMAN